MILWWGVCKKSSMTHFSKISKELWQPLFVNLFWGKILLQPHVCSKNKYLQNIEVDLGKANDLVSVAIDQLQRLRDKPDSVIEQVSNFKDCEWDSEKRRACLNQEGNWEDLWRRKTYYAVLDQIMSSLKLRFDQNKEIFAALSLFSP